MSNIRLLIVDHHGAVRKDTPPEVLVAAMPRAIRSEPSPPATAIVRVCTVPRQPFLRALS